jgi:ribosome-binding ATPase YchF (GTP1/OBG family)
MITFFDGQLIYSVLRAYTLSGEEFFTMISLAIAGKPNCGKSTFFAAATLAHAEIANYPFTTIDANHGVAYVRAPCPCRTLGVEGCKSCVDGVRFIQIGMIDVAGLVPDAHKGRGLGNQFLDHLRQANAILQLIDASGATDAEGNPVEVGSHDPLADIDFVQQEMVMWVFGILERHWPKIQRSSQQKGYSVEAALADVFAGLGVTVEEVRDVAMAADINFRQCSDEELLRFCDLLVRMSKPTKVLGNKADQAPDALLRSLGEAGITMVSSASELALRKAAEAGFIRYLPGDPTFAIVNEQALSPPQKAGLQKIREVMERFGGTGVQQAINEAVFNLLNMIVVYPVEDEHKYADSTGRILPDAFLMKKGSTPHDLAFMVHTDIGEGFLYAVDAKTRMRVKENHVLSNGDVIKIVSTKR